MPLPFAINTGSTISGTTQVGNIAIGATSQDYEHNYGGLNWLMGPDDDNGFVVAREGGGTIQFRSASGFTDSALIALAHSVSLESGGTGITSYSLYGLDDNNPITTTDFSIGMFSKEYVDKNGYIFGLGANDQTAYILPRYYSGGPYDYGSFVSDNAFVYYTGGTESTDGVFAIQRDNSLTAKIIWNGDVSEQSSEDMPDSRAGTGGFAPSRPFQICGAYGVEALSWVGGIWITDAFTNSEHQTMYEIMNQFKDDMYQLGQ